MEAHLHLGVKIVKIEFFIHIAQVPNDLAGHPLHIDLSPGGDFPGHQNIVGGDHDLHRHPGFGVPCQMGIQQGIGDLIGDLVGMPFSYRFAGKESCLRHVFILWQVEMGLSAGCSFL
jgi:hypothetical protein